MADRRPVGRLSSYHTTAAVASIFSRPKSRNPIRGSHRRDDLVSRQEPQAPDASALKGPDISAQGKATRVLRVSPSPWVAYHRDEKALKGRDNRCIGLCRPFRAWGPIATTTRGGATLCPGLICLCPFGTQHRAPEDPERRPEPADVPTGLFTSEARRARPTVSGLRTKRARRWRTPWRTDPIEAINVRNRKGRPTEFCAVPEFAHERYGSDGRRPKSRHSARSHRRLICIR